MAKIQVEICGQLHDVTKAKLFDLAKAGSIRPDTKIVVDGKETKARKVQGMEFAYVDEFAGQNESEVLTIPESESVSSPPVRVLTPEPEPQVEMTNRLLVLCLASLIPGLGHFLLGVKASRCFWICVNTTAVTMFYVFMWLFVALIGFWFCVAFPIFLLAGDFGDNPAGFFIAIGIIAILIQLVFPIILGYAFWTEYPLLISDLKREYSRRHR